MPFHQAKFREGSRFWVPLMTLNVFLVNRQWYGRACSAVYRMTKFQFQSAESFRVLFTDWIGPSNLGNIRRLALDLPYCLITMPSRYLAKYLRLLCIEMAALKELVLKTTIRRNHESYTDDRQIDTWTERHRGLLHTAAWVMGRNMSLKSAVWDEEGTVVNGILDDAKSIHRRDRRPIVQLSISMYAKQPESLKVVETPEAVRDYMESKSAEEAGKWDIPVTVSMIATRGKGVTDMMQSAFFWTHGRSGAWVGRDWRIMRVVDRTPTSLRQGATSPRSTSLLSRLCLSPNLRKSCTTTTGIPS